MRHHRWRFLKPPPGPPLVLQPLQHVAAKVPLGLAPQIEAGHPQAFDLAGLDLEPGGPPRPWSGWRPGPAGGSGSALRGPPEGWPTPDFQSGA